MSMNDVPALSVGKASANSCFAALLGQEISIGDNKYRLVKAGAAISAASGKVLLSGVSTSTYRPDWVVDVVATANDVTVAGTVPSGQVGSTGTTGLVSGDYFWLLVKGYDRVLANNASGVALGTAFGVGTGATLVAYTGADPMIKIVGFATNSGSAQTGATAGSLLGVQIVLGT
jgi:hypothetical protein